MKKFSAALLTSVALFALPAHAAIETFDTAASAAANGFHLSSLILYAEAGTPYLESYDQAHSITADTPFTFNSIDFNYDPWNGYRDGRNSALNMILFDNTNNQLLNTSIQIPTSREWITYSNAVANVSTIYFAPTNGFWPRIDNLTYNVQAAEVPEPATVALFGLGLLGFAASRRKSANSKNA
jgi:hypothetical protein